MVTDRRRLASWVAVGFVLLIPLQSWAGLKLIDRAIEAQKERLLPAENALRAIDAASDADQLLEAIRRIPGAPPNISGRFDEPVPKVRERLISQIEPQVRQQKGQLKEVIDTIRRDSLIALVKDGVVALLSALAFAAIGRSSPYRPALMHQLVGAPSPSSTHQRQAAQAGWGVQRAENRLEGDLMRSPPLAPHASSHALWEDQRSCLLGCLRQLTGAIARPPACALVLPVLP
ncbi:MAG: hypothetical protein ACKO45_00250 [Cyanobium sp.]